MSYPELCRGDKGEAVRHLQSCLNRVGAMLIADGEFGRGTEHGVRYAQDIAGLPDTGTADEALWSWLICQPEPFPQLGTDGVAFIAAKETGGLGYYQQVTRWPHFPGYHSGITLGVGYDLRFATESEFKALWEPLLPAPAIAALSLDLGRKGSKSRAQALKGLGIEVPFQVAWRVFLDHTLPKFYAATNTLYPTLEHLPPLCRSALVSIVFNRGTSLSGPSRLEMRTIGDLLTEADNAAYHKQKRKVILADIEDQILAMQRLWGPDSGLYLRRQAEANLWRNGLDQW